MEDSRDKLITIEGRQFIITKYNALTALKMKGRLIALLAPVIGNVLSDGAVSMGDREQLGARLLTVLPELDIDRATDLLVELCQSARHGDGQLQGNMVEFNSAFDADLMPAYYLAIEIVKFNYTKYLKTLSQGVADQTAKESTS